jgi:hypothetical protein
MSKDIKNPQERRGPFAAQTRAAREARRERVLSLDEEPPRGSGAARSPDPYNTSGSFDRTKNWARIGKR